MPPEDIDDLFRQKLDGHATPPGDDLWARLQLPAAEAAPVDQLFREGLSGHATPPRRELWERLEDEHLRPQPRRKRRVAAWWQYSAAAVLLLMLLAGGAGLWRGGYLRQSGGEVAATKPAPPGQRVSRTPQADARKAELTTTSTEERGIAQAAPTKYQSTAEALATASEKNEKFAASQATASAASTSSPSIATTTQPRRPATAPQVVAGHRRTLGQQPDAAAAQLASNGGRKTPAGQHPGSPQVAPATTVAPAARDQAEAPTLALAANPTKADATPEIIEVDVRRGPEASRPAAPVVVADATPTPPGGRACGWAASYARPTTWCTASP